MREENIVYSEPHLGGMFHDDPDCEYLMGRTELHIAKALKRGMPACSCVDTETPRSGEE